MLPKRTESASEILRSRRRCSLNPFERYESALIHVKRVRAWLPFATKENEFCCVCVCARACSKENIVYFDGGNGCGGRGYALVGGTSRRPCAAVLGICPHEITRIIGSAHGATIVGVGAGRKALMSAGAAHTNIAEWLSICRYSAAAGGEEVPTPE